MYVETGYVGQEGQFDTKHDAGLVVIVEHSILLVVCFEKVSQTLK
jgi:hypothetical protein